MKPKVKALYNLDQRVIDEEGLIGTIVGIDVTVFTRGVIKSRTNYKIAYDDGVKEDWRQEGSIKPAPRINESLNETMAWAHCAASITRNIMLLTIPDRDVSYSVDELLKIPFAMPSIRREAYEPLWKNGIKITPGVKAQVAILIDDITAFCKRA